METVSSGEACEILTTVRARMRGLLGREPDERLHVLVPCSDVHTFGMDEPLDIAFIDGDGTVLEVYDHVGRSRRVRCRGAAATLERFARESPWVEPGDRLVVGFAPRAASQKMLVRKEEL